MGIGAFWDEDVNRWYVEMEGVMVVIVTNGLWGVPRTYFLLTDRQFADLDCADLFEEAHKRSYWTFPTLGM